VVLYVVIRYPVLECAVLRDRADLYVLGHLGAGGVFVVAAAAARGG